MKKAFTLIELLIVIAILGSLATMVVVSFRGSQITALDTKRQAELKQYQNALEVYAAKRTNYPANVNAVANTICATLGLTSCPDDPKAASGRHYRYISDAGGLNYVLHVQLEKTTEYFVLCSSGKVGKVAAQPTTATCPL